MLSDVAPRDLYSIRLDPDTVVKVDRIADDEGRTRSDVIRRLVAEALAAREQDTGKK